MVIRKQYSIIDNNIFENLNAQPKKYPIHDEDSEI